MARASNKTRSLAQTLGAFLEGQLLPDLTQRVAAHPGVAAAIEAQRQEELAAGRTADDPIAWRTRTLEQVGAAWLLGCVFVRYLEDRGLVDARRLAGPGAIDAQERFGAAFPGLAGNAREYLLAVFRECARLPGARELFAPRYLAALRLGPSAEVAAALLALLRETEADGALRWRFDTDDTRILGDLYQDLSAAVRERYALLQTPDFVERFILDHTLEPARDTFGLGALRVLDPTCGSGHFVLGAFARLADAHARAAPALPPVDHARAALAQVWGVDLNPFAVAITRFRLLVAFLRVAGIARLREAPELPLHRHIVVADALLQRASGTLNLGETHTDNTVRRSFDQHLGLDDPEAATALFRHTFHVVVGNPPYIVCRDAALRERYRERYPHSARGKYALAAPFTERFFQLAEKGGYVGLINANSFMKREFGKGLVEKVLPRLDLTGVVDTSGAYIPGHGTPTVILFGRHQAPQSTRLRAVLGRRGEPTTPDDPAEGQVWSSIRDHFDDPTRAGEGSVYENAFVTVADLPRASFDKHPWSLGGGGAGDLKEALERACAKRLEERVESIGFASFTGFDDVFLLPVGGGDRLGVDKSLVRPMIVGESVRDWACVPGEDAMVPYGDAHAALPLDYSHGWARYLWPFRTSLGAVLSFGGKTRAQSGDNWWEWYRWQADRYATPLSITFAFVATHNHFVLDRGGKVFKQSAPIIKLPASATEDDHLALLAWLNSSTACFWMKQVSHKKTSASQAHHTDPARAAYEFAGTVLSELPVPMLSEEVGEVARRLSSLGAQITAWKSGDELTRRLRMDMKSRAQLVDAMREGWQRLETYKQRAVYLQEELDWYFYQKLGLLDGDATRIDFADHDAPLGSRPFEAEQGYNAGVSERARSGQHEQAQVGVLPRWSDRMELLRHPQLAVVETREFKRQWRDTELNIEQADWRLAQERLWVERFLLDEIESCVRVVSEPLTPAGIVVRLQASPRHEAIGACAEWLDEDLRALVERLCLEDSVPFLAAQRLTASGLEKRAKWEHTWALQRREDAGEAVGPLAVPPKYERGDYRLPRLWGLRGKLDVPRERFVQYPDLGSADDPSPLYGWAGWDHRARAEALVSLYQRRRDEDGWTGARLVPLLAGLAELVPWLRQWHNDPEPGEDLGVGDAYAAYVEAELRTWHLDPSQLTAWRPAERAARRGRKGA
jgi:hypothetical protein